MNRPVAIRFLLALLLFALLGCKEEPPRPTPTPPDPGPQPEQYGTPFGQVPAPEAIAMYEVNPKVFSPARNLDGITARLDSIAALGINVVWLMPIYPTGEVRSVGSPYAIKDYLAIHPDYGDLTDLRELTDAAHARGMAVILDWVANHTAWDHPWMQKPWWYAQDANGNVIHPPGTNWQDVAELNYDNADMRQEMIAAMKYWVLEANVDGYRCDYAGGAPADFWEAAIDTLESIPGRDLILFAETEEKSLLGAGFDLIFGWPYYGSLLSVIEQGQPAQEIFQTHQAEYSTLPTGKHILRWITNHDQHAWDGTPQALFDSERGAMAAFVLASHMGGALLLYNGQEVMVPQQLPFFEGHNVHIDWNLNPAIKAEHKRLMAFRQQSEALRSGTVADYSTAEVVAFTRSAGSEEVLVLVNVRAAEQDFSVPGSLSGTSWYDAHTGEEVVLGGLVELEGYGYRVWRK